MKTFSDNDLIALGLKVQEWRTKGGVSVMKKYGKDHFSMLGKMSAERKKALKEGKNRLPIDNG